MRFSFGQELRQEQKQFLSQRMIQSMEILQLPLQQLEQRVEVELEENPLLEIDDRPNAEADSAGEPGETVDGGENEESGEDRRDRTYEEIRIDETTDNREDFRTAEEFASLYADTIDELPARSQNWLEEAARRHADTIASIPTREGTLADYLLDQLSWFEPRPELRAMVERIVYGLDRHGFFTESLTETPGGGGGGGFLGPQASEEDRQLAVEALELVQKLDPPGIATSGVRECLLKQLHPDFPMAEVLQVLISEHFEDIQHNRLPLVARKTGFSMETIREALARLAYLTPYPAAAFREEAAAPVTADVVLIESENGEYRVHIEDGHIPPLRINEEYRDLGRRKDTDGKSKEYIKHHVGAARMLIDAIHQRKATLRKVAQAIVDYQHDFFAVGPEAIKPLKMQQIADAVGMHVTTISRTCDEKWLLTGRGLYPLRRFFTGAVASAEGADEYAQDAVRLKLREIIDGEDKKHPFSDEDLVRELENAGMKIARRTVVKYRQSMDIPSSRQRREW